ncbi:MAG: hypothetical protein ACRDF4_09760 [Rhabdochlamydiaceae bacterium]
MDYKDELWTIDPNRGKMMIQQTRTRHDSNSLLRKNKSEQRTLMLSDLLSNSLSRYEVDRGSRFAWEDSAESLIYAYNTARSHNAINPTENLRIQFHVVDEENKKLKMRIQTLTTEKDAKIGDLTKERDRFKRMYEDCDTNKKVGNTEISSIE